MKQWKENSWWISWALLFVSQIVLAILFFNRADLVGLVYLGWIILAVGLVIGYVGVLTLGRKGGMSGKHRLANTTVLVQCTGSVIDRS